MHLFAEYFKLHDGLLHSPQEDPHIQRGPCDVHHPYAHGPINLRDSTVCIVHTQVHIYRRTCTSVSMYITSCSVSLTFLAWYFISVANTSGTLSHTRAFSSSKNCTTVRAIWYYQECTTTHTYKEDACGVLSKQLVTTYLYHHTVIDHRPSSVYIHHSFWYAAVCRCNTLALQLAGS